MVDAALSESPAEFAISLDLLYLARYPHICLHLHPRAISVFQYSRAPVLCNPGVTYFPHKVDWLAHRSQTILIRLLGFRNLSSARNPWTWGFHYVLRVGFTFMQYCGVVETMS